MIWRIEPIYGKMVPLRSGLVVVAEVVERARLAVRARIAAAPGRVAVVRVVVRVADHNILGSPGRGLAVVVAFGNYQSFAVVPRPLTSSPWQRLTRTTHSFQCSIFHCIRGTLHRI